MNKQLRQFERESKLEIFGLGKDRIKWESALEKFAELIVRECAELATKEYNNRGAIHGNDLLKHFGVEE